MNTERYDLDADIGLLDLDSCAALLSLTSLWQARRNLRTIWLMRAWVNKKGQLS